MSNEEIEKKREDKLKAMKAADERDDLSAGKPAEVGKDVLVGAPAVAAQEQKDLANSKDLVFDVHNLKLNYGDFEALHGINMKIERNKVTAFIGPSGCGKSTFLRCLNRMNDLNDECKIRGEILFHGTDINKTNPILLRTKVGMVFQQPNPFPMSIWDNITYGPRCQGVHDRKFLNQLVESSLKEAALWDEVKDKLKQSGLALSGGQQQRLCIARCIAMKPEVILMDEPTSALDPIATKKVEELVTKLKEKYTIVIVTHNMQQATRVSDYTAFFMLGNLIEFAPTQQFFSHPKEKKSEDYITGRFS